MRTAQEVLDHHLQAFGEGIDAIVSDFTEDSVVFTPDATFTGLSEIRAFFTAFVAGMPDGIWDVFTLTRNEVAGDVAYIVWHAHPWFPLGTDTFVVKDGKIQYQTFAAYVAPQG